MHERDGKDIACLVSNKHVVQGMREGKLTFTLATDNGDPDVGNTWYVRFSKNEWDRRWVGHPDPSIDIAICPLNDIGDAIKRDSGRRVFMVALKMSDIPTVAQEEEFDAIEAITFIGYPNGTWDTKNFLPITRRGYTASPISVDFDGEPKFLIDASVFGGSSGSPVVLLDHGPREDSYGNLVMGARFHFLGVVAQVMYRSDANMVYPIAIPTNMGLAVNTSQMIDIGIVFKARTVSEAVAAAIENYQKS